MEDKIKIKKTEQLKVRLTPDELFLIKEKSALLGITISKLVCQSCLSDIDFIPPKTIWRTRTKTVHSRTLKQDPELVRQLAWIGNNLNQLTRQVNINLDGELAKDILFAIEEFNLKLEEAFNYDLSIL